MVSSRGIIASLLLSTALTAGACNSDKGGDAKDTAIAVAASSDLSAKHFEKRLKVDKRSVSEADSNKALKGLGLDKTGSGNLSWDAKTFEGGAHTYTNLTATGDDGESITIGTLTVTGAHMVGDEASFDRMDMSDFSMTGDDGKGTIKRFSIAHPSNDLGAAIMTSLDYMAKMKDLDDLDIDMDDEDKTFTVGALLIEGLNFAGDDGQVNLDMLGWGEDDKSGKGDFLMENLKITAVEDAGDPPINVSLGSISGSGINVGYFRDLTDKAASGAGGFPGMGLNPYAQQFKSYAMKDLDINVDGMSIVSEGIVGSSQKKGDDLILTQTMKPLTLSFTSDPTTDDIKEAREGLAKAGFEKIVIKAGGTSIMNEKADRFEAKNSYVELVDEFKLAYEYRGTGLKSLMDAVEDAEGGAAAMDPDAVMENMTLENFELNISDYGLVEKLINIAAEQQGTSANMLKMQAKSGLMMPGMMAQNEAQADLAQSFATAAGAFIDQGGILSIKIKPAQPVKASTLKDINPATFDPSELGISVSHSGN